MYIFIGCTVGVLALILLISYVIFRMAFYSDKDKHIKLYDKLEGELDEPKKFRLELINKMVSEPYEDVYVYSHDGLKLHARLYERDKSAPLSIQFHGYKSISVRDMSGGGKEALALGHNLLLVDMRAHGESEGRVISFGIKERFDVLAWVNFGIERYGNKVKILLTGISMGAGTVLMASELPLPENVFGILADCPFSTPLEIIKKVGRDMKLPATILTPLIMLAARLFGGFSITAASPVAAVKRIAVPLLVIHGESDTFVPSYMSDEIAAANPSVMLEKFPDADHAACYLADTERYLKLVDGFVDENIK